MAYYGATCQRSANGEQVIISPDTRSVEPPVYYVTVSSEDGGEWRVEDCNGKGDKFPEIEAAVSAGRRMVEDWRAAQVDKAYRKLLLRSEVASVVWANPQWFRCEANGCAQPLGEHVEYWSPSEGDGVEDGFFFLCSAHHEQEDASRRRERVEASRQAIRRAQDLVAQSPRCGVCGGVAVTLLQDPGVVSAWRCAAHLLGGGG